MTSLCCGILAKALQQIQLQPNEALRIQIQTHACYRAVRAPNAWHNDASRRPLNSEHAKKSNCYFANVRREHRALRLISEPFGRQNIRWRVLVYIYLGQLLDGERRRPLQQQTSHGCFGRRMICRCPRGTDIFFSYKYKQRYFLVRLTVFRRG